MQAHGCMPADGVAMSIDTIAVPDLAFIVDNLEEGIIFLDKNRRIVTINKSAKNMIGLDEGQQTGDGVVGQLCPDLFPGAACAGDCARNEMCSLMTQSLEKEKFEEITFDGPGGQSLALNLRTIALSESDTVACAVVLTNRTHERKLEEQVSQRIRMGGLVGRSQPMQRLFQQILRTATSDASVLIQGRAVRERSWSPRRCMRIRLAPTVHMCACIAQPCRKIFWKPSCSGMPAAPIPAQQHHAPAVSRLRTRALCCWMRSGRYHHPFK